MTAESLGTALLTIDLITVPKRLRSVDLAWVEALAASMAENGLQQPVQVCQDAEGGCRLVAGAHRLEAAKRLGWETIDAAVIRATEDEARILEIDENLFRRELSAFDRAKFLAERQAIWERLHPETKRGQGRSAKRRQQNDMLSFSEDAAGRIGLSPRSIQRFVKLWRDLWPETRALIEGSELADNAALLKKIAKLPAHEQEALVRTLLVGERRQRGEDTVEDQVVRLTKAWNRAGPQARQRFREIAGLA